MSTRLCRFRSERHEKSELSFDQCVYMPNNCYHFRREKNPVERKKMGSKSKHAKKFSGKKAKGAVGNRKPKAGGAGRKRR